METETLKSLVLEIDQLTGSTNRQLQQMSPILEKSSTILLQVENFNSSKLNNPLHNKFTYNQKSLLNLTKTLELYKDLVSCDQKFDMSLDDFTNYQKNCIKKVEYLVSLIRRLQAFSDTGKNMWEELKFHDRNDNLEVPNDDNSD